MPSNTRTITQGNETLLSDWQKESWQTFEEASGHVRPERVTSGPTARQIDDDDDDDITHVVTNYRYIKPKAKDSLNCISTCNSHVTEKHSVTIIST
jgi:hypothetical protein